MYIYIDILTHASALNSIKIKKKKKRKKIKKPRASHSDPIQGEKKTDAVHYQLCK